jgi:hypothetical protein
MLGPLRRIVRTAVARVAWCGEDCNSGVTGAVFIEHSAGEFDRGDAAFLTENTRRRVSLGESLKVWWIRETLIGRKAFRRFDMTRDC